MKLPVPTEAQEGETLVAYLRVKGYKFTHVPNETGGTPEALRRAIRVKRQGVSKGFPDYVIIKDNELYFIELKRLQGSRTSFEQTDWIAALSLAGARCCIAKGAGAAIDFLEGKS